MKPRSIIELLLLLIAFYSSAAGEYREAVGWKQLVEELGAETPTGAGVKISLIESAILGTYGPDRENFDFMGKTFTMLSGESGNSNHATVVGQRLFGNSMSMAGGIERIDVYESVDWLLDGFLQVGRPVFPSVETSQIQNHSWVGSFDEHEFNVEAMRRLDYAIERDGFVAVVALRNDTAAVPPLLAHAYNVISVGRPSGDHSRGGTWFDEPGRSQPDIVAPGGFFTSYSAPVVSSAVALLLEEAGRTTELRKVSIYPQVVKAILLAGARKTPFPEWERTETQPLDPVFGAGQLDIKRSHSILIGGEHESGKEIAPARGWHVGRLEAGNVQEFHFSFNADQESFAAHLSWHRQLALDQPEFGQASVLLGEFEMHLYTADENGANSELQISRDPLNNGQHLYLRDLSPGNYVLKVRRIDEGNFEVVHALAWSATDVGEDSLTTFAEWQNSFFSEEEIRQPAISGAEADPDGDGIPNLLEYGLGGDPRRASRDILPVLGTSIVGGSEYLSLTFSRPAELVDVRYRVDASDDPSELWFEDVGLLVSSQPQGDGTIIETWRDTKPISNKKRFLRLTVSIGAGR